MEHAFERAAISAGAWWAIVPAGRPWPWSSCRHLIGTSIEDALNPRLRASSPRAASSLAARPLVGRPARAL